MAKSRFNADSQFSPIEITLGGEDYNVVPTSKALNDVKRLADEIKALGDDNNQSLELLDKQLAVLLGIDPSELTEVDFRSKAATLQYIMTEINDVSASVEKKTR